MQSAAEPSAVGEPSVQLHDHPGADVHLRRLRSDRTGGQPASDQWHHRSGAGDARVLSVRDVSDPGGQRFGRAVELARRHGRQPSGRSGNGRDRGAEPD